MQCPKCGSTDHTAIKTDAADKHTDGAVHRRRKCHTCASGWMTMELPTNDVRSMQQGLPPAPPPPPPVLPPVASPLPVRARLLTPMIDIETEMESLLRPALDTIRDALATADPSRAKIEVAKWVVNDRREHRKALAEYAQKTGQAHTDPVINEFAQLLAMLPPDTASA